MLNIIAIIFHLIAINIWVGGMFFIIVVLGKVVSTLDHPSQQVFWQGVLRRFFSWVWLAVIALLASGIGMFSYRFADTGHAPSYVMLMAGLGISMVVVFFVIYFIYYRRFQNALAEENIEAGQQQLRIIRRLGIVNMILGFSVVVVIGGGPYLLY